MPAVAMAIPVNPNTPAISATIKNPNASRNIAPPSRSHSLSGSRCHGSAHGATPFPKSFTLWKSFTPSAYGCIQMGISLQLS
jgi:hypothetical protein